MKNLIKPIAFLLCLLQVFCAGAQYRTDLVEPGFFTLTNRYPATMKIQLVKQGTPFSESIIIPANQSRTVRSDVNPSNYKDLSIDFIYDRSTFYYDLNTIISRMRTEAALLDLLGYWLDRVREQNPDNIFPYIFDAVRDSSINGIKRQKFHISLAVRNRYQDWLSQVPESSPEFECLVRALALIEMIEEANLPHFTPDVATVVNTFLSHPHYQLPVHDFVVKVRRAKLIADPGYLSKVNYAFTQATPQIKQAGFSFSPYYQAGFHYYLEHLPRLGKYTIPINRVSMAFTQSPLLYAAGDSLMSTASAISYQHVDILLALCPGNYYSEKLWAFPFITAGYRLNKRIEYSTENEGNNIKKKTKQGSHHEPGNLVMGFGITLGYRNVLLSGGYIYSGKSNKNADPHKFMITKQSNFFVSLGLPLLLSKPVLKYN